MQTVITKVRIAKFSQPIVAEPGDRINVTHVVEDMVKTVETRVATIKVTEVSTFTHSILCEINGSAAHIIGDQKVVDWALANLAPGEKPLLV